MPSPCGGGGSPTTSTAEVLFNGGETSMEHQVASTSQDSRLTAGTNGATPAHRVRQRRGHHQATGSRRRRWRRRLEHCRQVTTTTVGRHGGVVEVRSETVLLQREKYWNETAGRAYDGIRGRAAGQESGNKPTLRIPSDLRGVAISPRGDPGQQDSTDEQLLEQNSNYDDSETGSGTSSMWSAARQHYNNGRATISSGTTATDLRRQQYSPLIPSDLRGNDGAIPAGGGDRPRSRRRQQNCQEQRDSAEGQRD